MTVVQNQITSPDKVGAPGSVSIRLLGPSLHPESRVSVLAPFAFYTEADGTWSRDLLPNPETSPYYQVTEFVNGSVPQTYLIHVEDSAAAVWLGDLVVRIPLPAGVSGLPYRGPEGQPGPPGPPGNISGAAFAEAVATQMNDGTAARTKLDGEYEPRIDRTNAAVGDFVAVGANGTLVIVDPPTSGTGGGTGTVTSVNGESPVNGAINLSAADVGAVTEARVRELIAELAVLRTQLVISADEPTSTSGVWIDT